MHVTFTGFLLSLGHFAAMTALRVAGHAMAGRETGHFPERAMRGLGAVEGVAFGLLTLLPGFAFSSVLTRFETRKALIVE